MIIAIEGLDGVGKTTIAKHIANKFNFKFIDKPVKYIFGCEDNPEQLNRILDSVYRTKDPIIKTWFFALGNIMGIRENYKENLVLDRHFVSNYFWNSDDSCKDIYNTLFKIVGKPDITIMLYAERETIRNRIKLRDKNDPDLIDSVGNDEDFIKMVNFARKNGLQYRLINTDKLTTKQVEERVDYIVENLINKKEERTCYESR